MEMKSDQPLNGITVIDCSTLLAGPYAATIMGDFGADVVKIEHPKYGDSLRHHGDYEEELHWKALDRNKKSVTVDLHEPEGQAIIEELVANADVFIENFRPGRLEDWNLGWDKLSDINEDLVMVRTTGFGQTGPYKDLPGFGTLAEAMSGFAYLTGWPDKPPTLPAFGLADGIAALHSTFATMFALYWRDVSGGTGQYIDVSVLEPIFTTLMHSQIVEYSVHEIVRERMGNRVPFTAPRNTYKTKDDRYVAISTSAENIAQRVLRLVGGEELATNPKFDSMQKRVENVDELDALIQDWIGERTREEAIQAFRDVDAAIAPIYSIQDIFADDYFWERDTIINLEDEELGEIAMPGAVPKLSKTPGEIKSTGPPLGEHTREVLRSRTSLSDSDIDQLAETGTIRPNE